MKKFLVLYRMDMAAMRKMMGTTSKEEQQKGMAEWGGVDEEKYGELCRPRRANGQELAGFDRRREARE